MSLTNELVEFAQKYEKLKTQCGGSLTVSTFEGITRVFISQERFKKLFDLYQVKEACGTTYLTREIDGVEFTSEYNKEQEDDF